MPAAARLPMAQARDAEDAVRRAEEETRRAAEEAARQAAEAEEAKQPRRRRGGTRG